jgi:hypothetical protein
MKLLLWQYPKHSDVKQMIGPLTFEAIAAFCMRCPAEDVQLYHHKAFAHLPQQAETCPPGILKLEGCENKHSHTKVLVKNHTRKNGCGVTVLSELTPQWANQVWRFSQNSIKEEMREILVEDLEKCHEGSKKHEVASASLDIFDAIPMITYDAFREIQLKFKSEHNQKRSTVPVDLTDSKALAKKKARIEKTNSIKGHGWKNML